MVRNAIRIATKLSCITLLSAAVVTPSVALQTSEQAAPVPPQPRQPATQEELQQAINLLAILNAAFTNEQVPQPVKGKLFDCLFSNSLQTINSTVQQGFAENTQLSNDNSTDIYRITLAVCGVTDEDLKAPASPSTQETPQTETPGR